MEKIKVLFQIRCKPDKTTMIVIILGTINIGLSFLLPVLNNRISFIILRDILQAGVFGIIIPVILLQKNGALHESGLNFDKPLKNLSISCMLIILFGLQFYFEDPDAVSLLSANAIVPGIYIMLTNIFEVIMYFCFMRHFLEKAFGILPSIVLSALFYSLHHAGFQPEFGKLLIVGIVFISIFRTTRSLFLILPVWWFCALWDVLLNSQHTKEIYSVTVFQVSVVAFFVIAGPYLAYKKVKTE